MSDDEPDKSAPASGELKQITLLFDETVTFAGPVVIEKIIKHFGYDVICYRELAPENAGENDGKQV